MTTTAQLKMTSLMAASTSPAMTAATTDTQQFPQGLEQQAEPPLPDEVTTVAACEDCRLLHCRNRLVNRRGPELGGTLLASAPER